jgi:ADP-heptose:LPS heptosyltransferase
VEWFNDQPLRPRPHLAVLFYDAIGDFVVVTPLLRGLREKYPGCTIDYLSGERTRDLEAASPLIDARFSVFGDPEALRRLPAWVAAREAAAGPYDLAINCDFHPLLAVVTRLLAPRYVVGRCLGPDLRDDLPRAPGKVHQLHDEYWAAPDLLERYGDVLTSPFIGEILCRLAFVTTDFHRTTVPATPPPAPVPDVLIATGGRRPAKLWPAAHWRAVIAWCAAQGLTVGLLGDRPAAQAAVYHAGALEAELLRTTPLVDLRGRFRLPEVAGALQRARACVSVDNGIMHLAYSVGTPTIAIFGASPWWLWTPRVPHLQVVTPPEPCACAAASRFRHAACAQPARHCLAQIRPEMVIERLASVLRPEDPDTVAGPNGPREGGRACSSGSASSSAPGR